MKGALMSDLNGILIGFDPNDVLISDLRRVLTSDLKGSSYKRAERSLYW